MKGGPREGAFATGPRRDGTARAAAPFCAIQGGAAGRSTGPRRERPARPGRLLSRTRNGAARTAGFGSSRGRGACPPWVARGPRPNRPAANRKIPLTASIRIVHPSESMAGTACTEQPAAEPLNVQNSPRRSCPGGGAEALRVHNNSRRRSLAAARRRWRQARTRRPRHTPIDTRLAVHCQP